MAIGRGRVSEAPTVSAEAMAGTRGGDGNGVMLPTVGYRNPGATENLRGVEPNTGKLTEAGNSYDLPKQEGSFSAMSEEYPNCGDPHTGVM